MCDNIEYSTESLTNESHDKKMCCNNTMFSLVFIRYNKYSSASLLIVICTGYIIICDKRTHDSYWSIVNKVLKDSVFGHGKII